MGERQRELAMNGNGRNKPILFVLGGIPGSGKSSLAGELAKAAEATIVSRDRIRTEQGGWGSDEGKQDAWDATLAGAEQHLKEGKCVIIDGATLSRRSDREQVRTLAGDAGAHFFYIHMDCPLRVAQMRAFGQSHPSPHRKPDDIAEVAARFEPFDAGPMPDIEIPHTLFAPDAIGGIADALKAMGMPEIQKPKRYVRPLPK